LDTPISGVLSLNSRSAAISAAPGVKADCNGRAGDNHNVDYFGLHHAFIPGNIARECARAQEMLLHITGSPEQKIETCGETDIGVAPGPQTLFSTHLRE
jgi:hypothetical protein